MPSLNPTDTLSVTPIMTLSIKSDITLTKDAMVSMAAQASRAALHEWVPDNKRELNNKMLWVEMLESPRKFFSSIPFPALAAFCGIIGSVICETGDDLWVVTKLIEPPSLSNAYVRIDPKGAHFSVILEALQDERFLNLAQDMKIVLSEEEIKMVEHLRARGLEVTRPKGLEQVATVTASPWRTSSREQLSNELAEAEYSASQKERDWLISRDPRHGGLT